jgi:hypothetical protein
VLRITDPGAGQATEAALAEVTLEAEEIAAIVAAPEAVVDDSAIDRWAEIREGLAEASATPWAPRCFAGPHTNRAAARRRAKAGRWRAGHRRVVLVGPWTSER